MALTIILFPPLQCFINLKHVSCFVNVSSKIDTELQEVDVTSGGKKWSSPGKGSSNWLPSTEWVNLRNDVMCTEQIVNIYLGILYFCS